MFPTTQVQPFKPLFSATTLAFYRKLVEAFNTAEKELQQEEKHQRLLEQMRGILNTAESSILAHDIIKRHAKRLPGGFFDFIYVSSDSPRGRIETILDEYPRDTLLFSDFAHLQHQVKSVQTQCENQEAALGKAISDYQEAKKLRQQLEARNQVLHAQVNDLTEKLVKAEIERDEALDENTKLQEKVVNIQTENAKLLQYLAVLEAKTFGKPSSEHPETAFSFFQTFDKKVQATQQVLDQQWQHLHSEETGVKFIEGVPV